MSDRPSIAEGQILMGPLFNEQMRVETVAEGGDGTWVVGLVGIQTERFRKVTLTGSATTTGERTRERRM